VVTAAVERGAGFGLAGVRIDSAFA